MTESKPKGRPVSGNRMVGMHLRVPSDIRDFYMTRDNMSAEMRTALRAYMEQQLALIN